MRPEPRSRRHSGATSGWRGGWGCLWWSTTGRPIRMCSVCWRRRAPRKSEAALRALELGFFLGVGGPVTFKSADELRAVLRALPADRLLVETDAPYLAPVPYRGRRNEPAYAAEAGRALAELLGMPEEELAAETTANARRLFGRVGSAAL